MTADQITNMKLLYVGIAAVIGLCVGSFLNVVVYRLPIMIKRRKVAAQRRFDGQATMKEPTFNLSEPRSRCPACGHQIRWFENIPVASYIALGGKCSTCESHISKRYPAVESVTSILFALWIVMLGATSLGVVACIFSAVILAWGLIRFDKYRLGQKQVKQG